jgi:3-oxoacyl-[acyl-carrier-protein] synthase II
VTALKSQIGEYAGMGVMRMAAAILTLKNQLIPPTINLETQDEECKPLYVIKRPMRSPLKTGLLNGISFGGANVAIVFQKL